jgi:hypothetical protein
MSGNTPKTMSKGLMGMKVRILDHVAELWLMHKQFMQRAAAKSSPSSPSTPNGPPNKKARLSNGTSAPGTSDYEIIQSALVAEEEKRQAALDKAAQHAGETKWVLSFKDPLEGKRQGAMDVRLAGFAELDAEDDSEEDQEETKPIRMQFGGGVKRADVCITGCRERATMLTLSRQLSNPRKLRIQKGRVMLHLKSTTQTTPPQNSFARPNGRWPQTNATAKLVQVTATSRRKVHRSDQTEMQILVA